uniref:Senescence domain-containing protein n=1 Tax=Parastrongyloides trichosuri TaxID=131310 RepID=A0A0N4ZIJ4_PARTI
MAEGAKSLFDTVLNKTKEVVNTAADATKGLANVAYENVTKIIPGQVIGNNHNDQQGQCQNDPNNCQAQPQGQGQPTQQ